jgi:hypothetical protein
MDQFFFSSPAQQSGSEIQGLHSVCMTDPPEPVARVAMAMGAVYPQPLSFEELLASMGDRDALRGILFMLISSGFAVFHTYRPDPPRRLSAHPCANPLARWESAHTGIVTWCNHQPRNLDGTTRALLGMLDGTRDFEVLVSALAQVEGSPPMEQIRELLPQVLAHLSRAGLVDA